MINEPEFKPEVQITHRTKGRVRLLVSSKKRDQEFFANVERELRQNPTVETLLTNPITGSILIHFSDQWPNFRKALDSSSHFKVSSKRPRKRGEAISVAMKEIEKLDQKLLDATQGELNLPTLVGLTMLGLGLFQLTRKELLPPASTLLTEGMRILNEMNEKNKKAA